MSISAGRQSRMSHQVMDEPTTSTTQYLILVNGRHGWRNVGVAVYRTPEAARKAALDGNTSPVAPGAEWRIVRSVSTWETVDTSGM
jgi:hypothetical protein